MGSFLTPIETLSSTTIGPKTRRAENTQASFAASLERKEARFMRHGFYPGTILGQQRFLIGDAAP